MKRKAHYSVSHTQIKTFTASSGAQHVSIDNEFLGPIPEEILIALDKKTTFVSSASTNTLHFHHYNMTNLVLYVITHPLELLRLTKTSFQLLAYITMTVLT